MKFYCKVSGLLDGISPVVAVSSHSAPKDFDGSNKINLESKNAELEASAFNSKVAIKNVISDLTVTNLCYSCSSEGSVTVNSVDLQNVLISFRKDDEVVVQTKNANKGKELVISRNDDQEEYQTLPCVASPIDVPKKATKFEREVVVDKSTFIHGINRTFWAVGFEDSTPQYLHWAFRVDTNKARFVCGTGARFAALDIEGNNFISCTPINPFTILFPKGHTETLKKIFGSFPGDEITIKANNRQSSNFQIVIEAGSFEILFVSMDSDIEFPDENKIIDMSVPNRFVTSLSEWSYVGSGIAATYNEEIKKERRPSNASVVRDDKNLVVKIDGIMRASRKVPIIDSNYEKENVDFVCSAPFLREISEHGGDQGNVQIEIVGEDKAPIIVRYYALDSVKDSIVLVNKNEASGLSERFTVFFASLSKKI